MDTDKLRECTLRRSVGQHVFGISISCACAGAVLLYSDEHSKHISILLCL